MFSQHCATDTASTSKSTPPLLVLNHLLPRLPHKRPPYPRICHCESVLFWLAPNLCSSRRRPVVSGAGSARESDVYHSHSDICSIGASSRLHPRLSFFAAHEYCLCLVQQCQYWMGRLRCPCFDSRRRSYREVTAGSHQAHACRGS